jgi:competence ComEA-like helix-hairpin-helix protein
MHSLKPYYFSVYRFLIKLLVTLIFGILTVSCQKKEINHNLIVENAIVVDRTAINVNTAAAAELEKLPGIGVKLSQKIVEHREKYGPFRRPEQLILVPGLSDQRFRQMRHLIRTE